MASGARLLTVLTWAALAAAACVQSARAVAVRVPFSLPEAPALQMHMDFPVSGPALSAAGPLQLTAPSLNIENGAGGVLWRDLPVQIRLASPVNAADHTALPLAALAGPAHGPFQAGVFGRLRTALQKSGWSGESVAVPEGGLGRPAGETDEKELARLVERLEAAGGPAASSSESDRVFDGADARLTSLGFPSRDIAEMRSRLTRLGSVLADPSVPAPVRSLLLHNSALATTLGGKPVTEMPLSDEPRALELMRSPEGAQALRQALARVSPDLDAVLTSWAVLMFDRKAVAATASSEATRRAGFDSSRLLSRLGDPAAFREALNAVYASVVGAEQGLLFGYPLSAVKEYLRLRGTEAPYHIVEIHGGSGIGEVSWCTIDPLHPESMLKILWYAGVLDHFAAYLRGRGLQHFPIQT